MEKLGQVGGGRRLVGVHFGGLVLSELDPEVLQLGRRWNESDFAALLDPASDPPVGIVIRTRMSYAWKLAMCIGCMRHQKSSKQAFQQPSIKQILNDYK